MRRWSFLALLLVATECTGNDYSLGHGTGGATSGAGASGSVGQPTGQGASTAGLDAGGGSVFAGGSGARDSAGGANSGAGEPSIQGGTTLGSGGTSSGAPGEAGDRNSRGGNETGGSITNGEGGSAGQITLLPCEAPVTRTCLDVLPLTTLGAGGTEEPGSEPVQVEDLDAIFPHPSVVAFPNSILNAVNASGQIAGARVCRNGLVRAALFEDGVPRDLSEALGAEYSEAKQINDNGMVIGQFAYRFPSQEPRASLGFIWRDGVVTKLEELGTVSMVAVNEEGQVLIAKALEPGPNDPGCRLWDCGVRGLIWRDGVATDLGTLGGASTFPIAMNNHGVVIGRSQRAGAQAPNDGWYAFIWQDGAMTELSEPSIPFSEFLDMSNRDMWINDAGQIGFDAQLWEGDQPVTPNAPSHVSAQAFDHDRTFAGVSEVLWAGGEASSERPIVFKNGLTVPLWGNVQGREFFDGEVRSINHSGLIVGTGNTVTLASSRFDVHLVQLTSQAVVWSPDCYLGCCSEAAAGAGGQAGSMDSSAGGAGVN